MCRMLVLSRVLFVSLALVSSTLLASDPAVPPKSPLSPEESLKHLVLGDPNLVIEIVAAEPEACPTITKGKYAYDFGDTAQMTPLTKMHTLGSAFVPPGFHAGGLRYHGMAPLVSHAHELGLLEARAYHQTQCFEAGVLFAKAPGG